MQNEIERLLSMGKEAYDMGLNLVDTFEKNNPAFSKALGQSLAAQYKVELLSYLLFLAETDGRVDEREAAFIDKVLGFNYTAAELDDLMHRLNLHEQGFGNLIPTALKAAVQYDASSSGSLKASQSIVRILDRIGEAFRLYSMKSSPLEELDQRIYILSLSNWLSDHGLSYPLKKTAGMPDLSMIENQPFDLSLKPAANKQKTEENKPEEKSLDELMEELNSLTGLQQVKEDVSSLVNLLKIKKLRSDRNLKNIDVSMHLVFTGNPGTGKTTVARLLAQIYHALGALSKGQLVEVDRSELVGGYVGQTAIKTQEVTDSALGGVLFIDEAYSLTSGKDKSDFGYEAVNTLLVEMENHRDDLAVIVAGYPDLMEEFLQSNPGLKSRFNKFISFPDYKPEELYEILQGMIRKNGYVLDENAAEPVKAILRDKYEHRDDNFANGREVRNFFEKAMVRQANRLAQLDEITDQQLTTLLETDFTDSRKDNADKSEEKPAPETNQGGSEKKTASVMPESPDNEGAGE